MAIRSASILSVLEQKREQFDSFDLHSSERRQQYLNAMRQLKDWPSLKIYEQLSTVSFPGSLPTEEWDHYASWQIPFAHDFHNHEESLLWVNQTIQNISTFAVDGSQIYPSKDISLPIALIQIGWFENRHTPEGLYEKDIRVDVLSPSDLGANNSGDPKERIVNMRRFEMEIQRIIEYMEHMGSHQQHRSCLAFLDGSLIASFAEAFEPSQQDRYIQSLLNLLRASETYRVPLVAYIDTTYTRDLITFLQYVFDLPEAPQLHDAQLLETYLEWGDRSPCWVCARGGLQSGQTGILHHYQEMRERVGFVYLKTNDNYPVRLEIPIWIQEMGWLDWLVDIVRCEVIIGRGYPYAIETADQTAVLRNEDRHIFLKVLQDWSQRENLHLKLSRKTVSKMQRRRVR
ncbi:MAG: DNA double-strand break repair nuclease NurA [Cyanobacteriota bacterium]|nr:DNA double-strand break repair nuclease NurA [Cyanobacteriota bacterium]